MRPVIVWVPSHSALPLGSTPGLPLSFAKLSERALRIFCIAPHTSPVQSANAGVENISVEAQARPPRPRAAIAVPPIRYLRSVDFILISRQRRRDDLPGTKVGDASSCRSTSADRV